MVTVVSKLHTEIKAALQWRLWMANTKIQPLLHSEKYQYTVNTAVGQCTLCTTALSSTWYSLLSCPGGSLTSLTPPSDPRIQTRMNLFKPKLTTTRRTGVIRDLSNMGKLFCWVAVLTNLLLKARNKLKQMTANRRGMSIAARTVETQSALLLRHFREPTDAQIVNTNAMM